VELYRASCSSAVAQACGQLLAEDAELRRGPATIQNIRLRCRAHNELAAEQDFGRDFMLARKQG
jgi:hypothetical protein